MNLQIRTSITITLAISLLGFASYHLIDQVENSTVNFVASVFFQNSIETADIQKKFAKADSTRNRRTREKNQVKILIVAGHDDNNSGAMLGNIREEDLNMTVARKLIGRLSKEKGIDAHLVRDENGYTKDFADYLTDEAFAIARFRADKIKIMQKMIEEGHIVTNNHVAHNFAHPEMSNILYGVNKFANDNNFDIVLHIHFNDYPGRMANVERAKREGKYRGFAIYVPEEQYSNAEASYDFAEVLAPELLKVQSESNHPKESAISEDQELIAIGSNNSADAVSVLIEYGYIYEPRFTDFVNGDKVFAELADATYDGIMNYLRGE